MPGRNDDEHIIRCETSLNRNIAANPSRWAEDHEHPRHPPRRQANASLNRIRRYRGQPIAVGKTATTRAIPRAGGRTRVGGIGRVHR
jgi:hypothetical protein